MPQLVTFEEVDGEKKELYWGYKYNRPEPIDSFMLEGFKCYCEEAVEDTAKKGNRIVKPEGDKMTIHLAYLVDEDLLGNMALKIDNEGLLEFKGPYIDISQK
jgi:hypothetical protein